MDNITKLIGKSLSSFVLALGVGMPALAADVDGTWAVTFNTSQGGGSMELVLEQTGEVLKGNVSGDVGQSEINGKIENNAITFSHL